MEQKAVWSMIALNVRSAWMALDSVQIIACRQCWHVLNMILLLSHESCIHLINFLLESSLNQVHSEGYWISSLVLLCQELSSPVDQELTTL